VASDNRDEAPKRLSSDESLWGDQESKRKRGGPPFGVQVDGPPPPALPKRPDPDPPEPRPRRRLLLRVDLLIALAAVGLLLAGFLAGVAVTRAGTEEPPAAGTTTAVPRTSIVVQPAPPPRECLTAMERADAAIAYLVGNIRDQRLSDTIQEFVQSRRACQAAVR
jgi:hypothetical protein